MRSFVVASCLLALLFSVSALAARVAPLIKAENVADRIDGEYIILFNENITAPQWEVQMTVLRQALSVAADGSAVLNVHTIGSTFRAVHARLSPAAVEKLRGHPLVSFIEEHQMVHIAQSCTRQEDVIWNLGRIDTHDVNLIDSDYRYSYAGEGVDVYIIDTGVLISHVEFENRAEWGENFADNVDSDCNGHGTHVAGTVAGTLYGVAKKANIIGVKVLACSGSGTFEGVIAGVEWTANQARQRRRPSVANMSLGGGKFLAVNAAVAAAVDAGVVFAVAAGNENTDACTRSPASEPKAITVAATTIGSDSTGAPKDLRASFSNFGTCVDIAAPGQLVKAAWINAAGYPPNQAYNTISGTSMASPHVAGVAALILSKHPSYTPAQVEEALYSDTTNGVIELNCPAFNRQICLNTPNKLLYTNC